METPPQRTGLRPGDGFENPEWPVHHLLSDEVLKAEICDASKTGLRAAFRGGDGEHLGTATAFAVSHDRIGGWPDAGRATSFITSLHSVTGIDTYSRVPRTGSIPKSIALTVYFNNKSNPVEVVLPLTDDENAPLWREHPDLHTVNLACIDAQDDVLEKSKVFRADIWSRGPGGRGERAALYDPLLFPGDPVVLSAFPLGQWSLGVFPLVLQGTLASTLENHMVEFGGPAGGSVAHSEGFLVDCSAAGDGCDGALVSTLQRRWTSKTGFDVEFDYPASIPLGVYARALRQGSSVGHVIPIQRVRELVSSGRVPDQHPRADSRG